MGQPGQVNHGITAAQRLGIGFRLIDRPLNQLDAWSLQVSRVRVVADQAAALVALSEQCRDEVPADESGSAGHKDLSHIVRSCRCHEWFSARGTPESWSGFRLMF